MNGKIKSHILALYFIEGIGARGILNAIENGDYYSKYGAKIEKVINSDSYSDEINYIKENNISTLCIGEDNYPENLDNIYDKPPLIFSKGKLEKIDKNAIAIVGARRASDYGLNMAEKLAFGLAERGITVVSGMAAGIDTAAHKGALKAGGRTIAVLGSGFGHVYSRESLSMVKDISSSGAVITEFLSDTNPAKWTFPKRNRIISGLSKGVVVVEAGKRSGALITADFALEQSREVFAVPGRADFYSSQGTNKLIQNGAKLVTTVDDILEEIRYSHGDSGQNLTENKVKNMAGSEEEKIIDVLDTKAPSHIDDIIVKTGISFDKLTAILLSMEMGKIIKAVSGSRYIRVN